MRVLGIKAALLANGSSRRGMRTEGAAHGAPLTRSDGHLRKLDKSAAQLLPRLLHVSVLRIQCLIV